MLRSIRAGVEYLPPGFDSPRHRHLGAYVTLVLEGSFEQLSYAGRMVLGPGDILLQPTLDCHSDRMLSKGVDVFRIPWRRTDSFGGIYRGCDIDEILKAATHEPEDARLRLAGIFSSRAAADVTHADWEDTLASRLKIGHTGVEAFANEFGMSRETVSRGFRRAYGISPSGFQGEIRARKAWMEVMATSKRLCDIAVEVGFCDQAHMTRAVHALTGLPPAAWRRRKACSMQLASNDCHGSARSSAAYTGSTAKQRLYGIANDQ